MQDDFDSPDTMPDEDAAPRNDPAEELAQHVIRAFDEAKQHRDDDGVTQQMLEDQRQYYGEYDADTLDRIRKRRGSESFFNITNTKVNTAEAWLVDILNPSRGLPVYVRPTPVPNLSGRDKQQILNRFMEDFLRGDMRAMLEAGIEPPRDAVMAAVADSEDEFEREARKKAAEKAEKLQDKVRDTILEGDFVPAFKAFMHDLCVYQIGVIKGPVLRPQKRVVWDNEQQVHVVRMEMVPSFTAVSPHHYYPEPNSESPQDGYVCERINFDRQALADVREEPGWNTAAIEEILSEDTVGGHAVTTADAYDEDASELEKRDSNYFGGNVSTAEDAIEYWGRVQGRVLKDYGLDVAEDGLLDYFDVNAIVIGTQVVYAAFNPEHMHGQKPYYSTSYKKRFRSQFGTSIPMTMRWCQEGYNACMRNMQNNLALSSTPLAVIDIARLDPQETDNARTLYPGKVYLVDSSKAPGVNSKPIEWYQPDVRSQELLRTAEYYAQASDDATQIPRFAHGNADVQGAGETASGMEMLMSSAAKGIRLTLFNIDNDILSPLIRRVAYYLMNMDEELRGDFQIIARGALEHLIKEEQVRRYLEIMSQMNNPMDMQLMRLEHRRNGWETIMRESGLPADKLLIANDELLQEIEAAKQMRQEEDFDEGIPGEGQQGATGGAVAGAEQQGGGAAVVPVARAGGGNAR